MSSWAWRTLKTEWHQLVKYLQFLFPFLMVFTSRNLFPAGFLTPHSSLSLKTFKRQEVAPFCSCSGYICLHLVYSSCIPCSQPSTVSNAMSPGTPIPCVQLPTLQLYTCQKQLFYLNTRYQSEKEMSDTYPWTLKTLQRGKNIQKLSENAHY